MVSASMHEHGGEAELQAAPVRLEPSPQIGDARGVFRDLGGERIDAARGVQELAFGAGDRSDGDKDVAGAEKAAQRLRRSSASWKSEGSGLAISLASEPSAISSGLPSLFISAAALKPSVLARELK